MLGAFRNICDELLPHMRRASHLHNLIYRSRGNYTFIVYDKVHHAGERAP